MVSWYIDRRTSGDSIYCLPLNCSSSASPRETNSLASRPPLYCVEDDAAEVRCIYLTLHNAIIITNVSVQIKWQHTK